MMQLVRILKHEVKKKFWSKSSKNRKESKHEQTTRTIQTSSLLKMVNREVPFIRVSVQGVIHLAAILHVYAGG